METLDIALPRMALLYGLGLLPCLMLWLIGLRLSRDIGISLLRMSIQLALVGIYLKMLFDLNHPWLNGLWILVMLLVADLSILRRAGLKARYFVLATFMAIASSILFSTAYLVILVIQPTHFYDARYIVPLAGMILGNCLQGNVIALERFYSALRKNENEYATFLMLGATRWEAVRPYFRDAVKAAINPTIAGMATMGLVSLPGMMTGQILGGSEPWLAVKYQIAIMICIFTSTTIACIINLKLSLNIAFNDFDVLREEVIEKP
ncbi:iron export ABC transporter permease subunit FetB [Methylobacter sp.]|uniref:ABC transporter permease n=1 Tax=Methylobacter sp. TaxID=2051955 RepID=UPI002487308B|nr:iron export ABC transporter permease subunit FetB [Methylobacter sp.]MDI1277267.1 iron export ABC transporter permease subunit FetB [Methylobacter sp.]MDI1357833.1 iron export ABC transporter permease subunit FetB [Methylobacter sp.]